MSIQGSDTVVVCPTRDISESGCYLDTAEPIAPGTSVEIALLDHEHGEAVDLEGVVMRVGERGVGVKLDEVPDGWLQLVERFRDARNQSGSIPVGSFTRRLRILVVGDDARRRGALALYVTSGWDVRFASDLRGACEALQSIRLDAIIAEHDLAEGNWRAPLEAARREQPAARRIVRCQIPDGATRTDDELGDLIDRVVDSDSGMDALLDALTADLGGGPDAGSVPATNDE